MSTYACILFVIREPTISVGVCLGQWVAHSGVPSEVLAEKQHFGHGLTYNVQAHHVLSIRIVSAWLHILNKSRRCISHDTVFAHGLLPN